MSTPEEETPVAPAEETPVAPAEETPVAPAEETPAPVEETPSVPPPPTEYYVQVNPESLYIEILYMRDPGEGPYQPHHIRVPDELQVKYDANHLKAVRNEQGEITIVQRT